MKNVIFILKLELYLINTIINKIIYIGNHDKCIYLFLITIVLINCI